MGAGAFPDRGPDNAEDGGAFSEEQHAAEHHPRTGMAAPRRMTHRGTSALYVWKVSDAGGAQ
jgi:hypothetical protein